jgi:hypothetical protein
MPYKKSPILLLIDDPPSAETRPTNDGEYWIGVAPLLDMTGTARVLGKQLF